MATTRASFHFFGGMAVTDEIVIVGSRPGHTCLLFWPFFGRIVSSFVHFFFILKCYSLNSVTRLMEWRIEWTTLPCFVPMNKKLASLLFTGTFWLSWRPLVYGYCRVYVQMSETLFETKPFISTYVGKSVSLIITMKEISFLSHFHIERGYISFTLGIVCCTPSVRFSPSLFPSSLVYAAFSFTPESRESFLFPLNIFFSFFF